jgi:hypothetical protein
MHKHFQEDFCIRFSPEGPAEGAKFFPQLNVVIDFAVEDNLKAPIVRQERLVTIAGKVNNGKPSVAQDTLGVDLYPFVVRPAVLLGGIHLPDEAMMMFRKGL